MKNLFVFSIVIMIILVGCLELNKKNSEIKIAAIIANDTIFQHNVDSLISDLIYKIKRDALNSLINEHVYYEYIVKDTISHSSFRNSFKNRNQSLDFLTDSIKQKILAVRSSLQIEYYLKPDYFKK